MKKPLVVTTLLLKVVTANVLADENPYEGKECSELTISQYEASDLICDASELRQDDDDGTIADTTEADTTEPSKE